jgi:hypothetical protein
MTIPQINRYIRGILLNSPVQHIKYYSGKSGLNPHGIDDKYWTKIFTQLKKENKIVIDLEIGI